MKELGPMGLYPQLYVKKKDLLFPIINKYATKPITLETPHKEAIPVYFQLLKNNAAFRLEVDALIEGNKEKLLRIRDRMVIRAEARNKRSPEEKTQERLTGKDPKAQNKQFENAVDPITAIAEGVGNIFGVIQTSQERKLMEDQMFYEVILRQEQESETTKILVMSGIALAFIGVGYLIMRKK